MHDFDFDKGRKKEKKFGDSKPRHFPRKWPRQKEYCTEQENISDSGLFFPINLYLLVSWKNSPKRFCGSCSER